MYILTMKRLTTIDVKWSDHYRVDEPFDRYHANPYYELLMVTDGPLYLDVEGERLELEAGETLLLTPWERHRGWRPDCRAGGFFWVQFSCEPELVRSEPSTLPEQFSAAFHAERGDLRLPLADDDQERLAIPRRFTPTRRFKLLGCFEQIAYEFNHPSGYFRFRIGRMLQEVLELLSEDWLIAAGHDRTLPASYLTYRQTLNFVHNAYESELSPEKFEQALHKSYDHLSHVFKRYGGLSLGAYVQQLRIQRARHLLERTTLQVGEIARECGFEDPFYFSKVFKSVAGDSPSEYRRKQSGSASEDS